jgi:hypothetical protein
MLATSHMAWGYVFGKASARFEKIEPNIPLLILAGGIPDFDLFTRQPYNTVFGHHGISHSWIFITLLFVPFFFWFGRQTLPYYISVIQHPVFGDLVTNHIPLLYPLTLNESGFNLFEQNALAAIGLEILGFLIFVAYFVRSGDWKKKDTHTIWNKLWLLLWVPLSGITAFQAVIYFEPNTTAIYSAYAMISSVFLFASAILIAARSFR